MPDMMKPKVRTDAGDNSNVNSAVYGKIAESAPKNSIAIQQGDENQREGFNQVRGQYVTNPGSNKKYYTSKVSSSDAKKSSGAMAEYKYERTGGKGR